MAQMPDERLARARMVALLRNGVPLREVLDGMEIAYGREKVAELEDEIRRVYLGRLAASIGTGILRDATEGGDAQQG